MVSRAVAKCRLKWGLGQPIMDVRIHGRDQYTCQFYIPEDSLAAAGCPKFIRTPTNVSTSAIEDSKAFWREGEVNA